MESFLKNPFQNPFGGAMNPSGGGGGGVLEQIQEQVNTNGETLQSLQGGIGGLPSGNLPFGGIGGDIYSGHRGPGSPGTPSPVPITGKQQEGMPVGNVGAAPYDINNPLFAGLFSGSEMSTGGSGENPIRAQYDKAVEDARQQRANGFMGRMVLPGEMPFEEFSQNQLASANAGPLQSVTDLFNIDNQINNDPRFNLSVGAEQNPGMDYSQFTPTTGNLYAGELNGPAQTLDNYVPTNLFGVGGEQGFFNQSSLSEPPRLPTGALRGGGMQNNQFNQPGLDPLFGRAFAGKPV
jgi:hypothetical protein